MGIDVGTEVETKVEMGIQTEIIRDI